MFCGSPGIGTGGSEAKEEGTHNNKENKN